MLACACVSSLCYMDEGQTKHVSTTQKSRANTRSLSKERKRKDFAAHHVINFSLAAVYRTLISLPTTQTKTQMQHDHQHTHIENEHAGARCGATRDHRRSFVDHGSASIQLDAPASARIVGGMSIEGSFNQKVGF